MMLFAQGSQTDAKKFAAASLTLLFCSDIERERLKRLHTCKPAAMRMQLFAAKTIALQVMIRNRKVSKLINLNPTVEI